MKIIHTADWHLGNVFHRHNRVAEHRHFFGWLRDTIVQQQPDALIVSGDIFDGPTPPPRCNDFSTTSSPISRSNTPA